jgi:hypothetical protein
MRCRMVLRGLHPPPCEGTDNYPEFEQQLSNSGVPLRHALSYKLPFNIPSSLPLLCCI